MSERDGYEPGVPCWVAGVHPDPPAAAAFYAELFGWETEDLMPAGSGEHYIVCRLRGRDVAALVSAGPTPEPPEATWATHVWVAGTDAAAAETVEAGGALIAEPFDSPGGGRMAVVADPAGAVFCLWEPQGRRGAQLVNEPGAWAMSALATTNASEAGQFYGTLFGWSTEPFGPASLFRAPGYFGGEPSQPVPRDVVAVMIPDEGPPRWNVDFWIADAEAAAERTTALGGTVIAPPYDIPGFKQTVLADPQGAVFTASELMKQGA